MIRLWTQVMGGVLTGGMLKFCAATTPIASWNWSCKPIIHMESRESIRVTPHPLKLM